MLGINTTGLSKLSTVISASVLYNQVLRLAQNRSCAGLIVPAATTFAFCSAKSWMREPGYSVTSGVMCTLKSAAEFALTQQAFLAMQTTLGLTPALLLMLVAAAKTNQYATRQNVPASSFREQAVSAFRWSAPLVVGQFFSLALRIPTSWYSRPIEQAITSSWADFSLRFLCHLPQTLYNFSLSSFDILVTRAVCFVGVSALFSNSNRAPKLLLPVVLGLCLDSLETEPLSLPARLPEEVAEDCQRRWSEIQKHTRQLPGGVGWHLHQSVPYYLPVDLLKSLLFIFVKHRVRVPEPVLQLHMQYFSSKIPDAIVGSYFMQALTHEERAPIDESVEFPGRLSLGHGQASILRWQDIQSQFAALNPTPPFICQDDYWRVRLGLESLIYVFVEQRAEVPEQLVDMFKALEACYEQFQIVTPAVADPAPTSPFALGAGG